MTGTRIAGKMGAHRGARTLELGITGPIRYHSAMCPQCPCIIPKIGYLRLPNLMGLYSGGCSVREEVCLTGIMYVVTGSMKYSLVELQSDDCKDDDCEKNQKANL